MCERMYFTRNKNSFPEVLACRIDRCGEGVEGGVRL